MNQEQSQNTANNLYQAPGTELETKSNSENKALVIVLLIIAIALSVTVFFVKFSASLAATGNLSYSIGFGLGSIFFALIVMGLFQIGETFRSNKARLLIFNITLFVGTMSTLINYLR
ncbi:MAG: hypothetical protein HWE11_15120 [Gammaproteobacteria bacterium]|nr:hypothetical protein [Gammaproteobacteria bacterium]